MNNDSTVMMPMLNSDYLTDAPQTSNASYNGYNSTHYKGTTLLGYLNILKRYRLPILLILLTSLATALFLSFALIPTYVAKATVRINSQPLQVLDYDIDASDGYQRKLNDKVFYPTQYSLLRSKKLTRQVINELSLEQELRDNKTFRPFIHELVSPLVNLKDSLFKQLGGEETESKPSLYAEDIFLQNLVISPIKDSQIVEVSYTSDNAERSAQIVNQFVSAYINQSRTSKKESAVDAENFLRTELLSARQKLQLSEASLLEYAKQQNIINTGEEHSILANNLEDLSSAYIKAKEQRIIAESIFSKRQLAKGNIQASNSVLIGKLKTQLADLSAKYQESAKKYKSGYPGMKEVSAQINDLRRQIQTETQSIKNNTTEDLRTALLSAQQQEKNLNKEIQAQEEKLLSYEDKNLHYATLQREVETNRVIYEGLLQRLKEISIVGSSGSDGISIVDTAKAPLQSNNPKKLLNMLMGALAGLMLGLLYAFVKNFLNDKIVSVEDLENLKLPYPVLTALPNVTKEAKKDIPLLAVNKPNSTMAESIRYLFANLTCRDSKAPPKILLITSSLPGEGKSSTAINLASVLAKSGKRVLIIDGDLRKPTIHKHLNVSNKTGLSNYLTGMNKGVNIAKAPSKYPLFIIPAGPAVSDPVNLLSNERMMLLCDKVKNAFDHIIIDSPPALGMADSLVLSNRADATLFVIAHGKPTVKQVKSALKNIEKGRGNIVGLVFTKATGLSEQFYNEMDYSDNRQMIA